MNIKSTTKKLRGGLKEFNNKTKKENVEIRIIISETISSKKNNIKYLNFIN